MFELIVTLVTRTGNVTPSAEAFAAAVQKYSASIDEYRTTAENYEIQVLAECPPEPTLPHYPGTD